MIRHERNRNTGSSSGKGKELKLRDEDAQGGWRQDVRKHVRVKLGDPGGGLLRHAGESEPA